MVGAFRGLRDRELDALDLAIEGVASRAIVRGDRSAGVLADIAAVVSREIGKPATIAASTSRRSGPR